MAHQAAAAERGQGFIPAAAAAEAEQNVAATKKSPMDTKLAIGIALVALAVLGGVAAVVLTFAFAMPLMPIVASIIGVSGALLVSSIVLRIIKAVQAMASGSFTPSATRERVESNHSETGEFTPADSTRQQDRSHDVDGGGNDDKEQRPQQ
jgi:hypothetical protein